MSLSIRSLRVQRKLDFMGVTLSNPGTNTVNMFSRASLDVSLPSGFSMYGRCGELGDPLARKLSTLSYSG